MTTAEQIKATVVAKVTGKVPEPDPELKELLTAPSNAEFDVEDEKDKIREHYAAEYERSQALPTPDPAFLTELRDMIEAFGHGYTPAQYRYVKSLEQRIAALEAKA